MSSTRGRIALAVVVGAAALFLMARKAFLPNAGTDRVVELTSEEQQVMLDSSLRALEDGVRDAPRDRWDPEYVVAQVGRNPDSLHRWVQENTAWIPYRGTLRGPVGVLMDRQGNSLDRALLLADLLRRAGHSVRLARTVMPVERAEDVLPELAARRPVGIGGDFERVAAAPVPIPEAAEGYGLDGRAIEQTLERYDEATAELLNKVEERVASQTAKLLSSVDGIDPLVEWKARADSALAMLRDHWWVQLEAGDSWSDLDLVRPDSAGAVPMLTPLETVAPTSVDASLHHRVTIRVVTERFTHGRLVEERVFEYTLRPRDVIGQPIVLQFWPSAWPALEATTGHTARSLRQIALEQDGWSAALLIGNDAVASASLHASTNSAKPAAGIGGLGGAMARALETRSDSDDGQLTATSIDFVIEVPGRKPRVLRRSVFDLIGPAARHAGVAAVTLDEGQKLRRSLSLMMRTEILPLGAQPNADFVAHLAGRNMLANAGLLRAVSQPGFGSDARMTDSLLKTAEPGVGPLYALAVLRHEAISTVVFLDQPTILTRHRYPRVVGDSVGLVDATDIVANEVGITLSEADGFMARLAQGTWDTNLEALLGLAGGPDGNTAAAFDETKDWLTLPRDDKERLSELELPPDVLTRIGEDLESGYTVVVPQRPVTVDRQEFSAWWRIDRQTGDALGIAENGWGQGSEYGSLARNILIVGGRAFAFEYGLCQFIPQAANSLRVIGGEFWRLGIAPGWTRPPEPGKDFEDVAVENNRMCLKEAMLQGFLATAPLLIATARYRVLARMEQSAVRREAVQRMREAMKFCLCIRGPAGGRPSGARPGLTRAQARGGPIVPKGGGDSKMIDPLGKTQPAGRAPDLGKTLDLGKTQKGVPTPKTMPGIGSSKPQGPLPTSQAEAQRMKDWADDAYYRAANNASEKTGDWIRYRFEKEYELRKLNPKAPIPDFLRDDVHSELEAKMGEAGRARDYALTRAIYANSRLEWAKDAARRGEIPRYDPVSPPLNSSSCIPNCGASSSGSGPQRAPTGSPSSALEVGSSGLSSFFQGRWPTGNR